MEEACDGYQRLQVAAAVVSLHRLQMAAVNRLMWVPVSSPLRHAKSTLMSGLAGQSTPEGYCSFRLQMKPSCCRAVSDGCLIVISSQCSVQHKASVHMQEHVENVLDLPPHRRDAIGKLATVLKLRIQVGRDRLVQRPDNL